MSPMKSMRKPIFIIATFMICALLSGPAAYGAEKNEYISEMKIVTALSEEEAIKELRDSGYVPILKNIAEEKPELESDFVYLGIRTTTDPAENIENTAADSVGSVFGDSSLMIGGVAVILGVVIGMLSMRVRPREKKSDDK